MDENKKFELSDEALDDVAGGRTGSVVGEGRPYIRNPNYACSNCGGHEFFIVDGNSTHYSGYCVNCGTHNTNISHTDDDAVLLYC